MFNLAATGLTVTLDVDFKIHWCHTDALGNFEIKGLTAGHIYEINSLNEHDEQSDRNRFTIDLTSAKPGDTIDLGDVTGANRKRALEK